MTNSAHIRTQSCVYSGIQLLRSYFLQSLNLASEKMSVIVCLLNYKTSFFFQSLSEIKKNHYGTCIHSSDPFPRKRVGSGHETMLQ